MEIGTVKIATNIFAVQPTLRAYSPNIYTVVSNIPLCNCHNNEQATFLFFQQHSQFDTNSQYKALFLLLTLCVDDKEILERRYKE